jgi:DNA-binding NtrC family response regulator
MRSWGDFFPRRLVSWLLASENHIVRKELWSRFIQSVGLGHRGHSVIQMHDKAILVVGSDIRLRAEIRDCLQFIGLHAVVLAIGDEVPDRLSQLRFDAAVLEIDPSVHHYEESLLFIRHADPQCKIIAVSDRLGAPIERDLRVLGVRRVVKKPVGVFRLYRAMMATLNVDKTSMCFG